MQTSTEKTIFLTAIDQDDLAARHSYLKDACGNDETLRAGVQALLDAHDQPEHTLDRPPVSLPPSQEIEHVGKMIGPYRLMEQIGEGGFGLVFVAQQEHPVRRSVALKIIKPGTGSKEVIARFEAERQAVALMDHPNIAQVFDAGVTEDSRPYFVMELVRGVPLTEFADSHRFDIRQRLTLLIDVCLAVHHAHQKGVIHRDIKPSNVMVTLHDAKPVVKVIDFGVAKAVGQALTDKTIYTRFFSMIGTPLYMSPEQAEMSGLDVDTRSDIYSLGVMMYELLTGATPFDRDRIDSAGLDELRRIIREEEPPIPSKRLSTLGASMTTVSTARRTEPQRLSSSLRGDLDWIAMKALEKDRTRRYESPAAMAADLRRYLGEQPIEARPPTLSYQLSKFARRNRGALITGGLLVGMMFAGTGISLWQMNLAMDERDQKERALHKIEQFATNITQAHTLMVSAQTNIDGDQYGAAVDDFDEAVMQQPSYYLPWLGRAQFYRRINLWNEAATDFAHALELGAPSDSPQWWGVGSLFVFTGTTDGYDRMTKQIESRLDQNQPAKHWEWLRNSLAESSRLSPQYYSQIADLAESWLDRVEHPLYLEARRPERRHPGERHPGERHPGERHPGERNSGERNSGELNPDDQNRPHDHDPPRDREGFDQKPPPPSRNDGPPPRDPGPPSRDPGPPSRIPGPPPHNESSRSDSIEDVPRTVCQYVTGLAHLRAGNFDRAIDRLKQSERDPHWPARGLIHAPLAIAYHTTGEHAEAKRRLEQSDESVAELSKQILDPTSQNSPGAPPIIPWFDLIELLVTHREATQTITGVPTTDPEIIMRMRQESLNKIGR